MDLIPGPDQLLAAAGNLARAVRSGGLADTRPMPRIPIADGPQREVYRYEPDPDIAPSGGPVLLVSPLAAPATCYDLRRGCSLVEFLGSRGRPTYLVEYGDVDLSHRALGLERWLDGVLPDAIRAVWVDASSSDATVSSDAARSSDVARGVHLIGWSLGGVIGLLTAADQPGLPVASVVSAGAPYDVAKVPHLAPARPLLSPLGPPGLLAAGARALGVPSLLRAPELPESARGPLLRLQHLDDAEALAQLEAVGRFSASITDYPGRGFGQVYHRFLGRGALAGGGVDLGSRTVDLAGLSAPVLVVAGANDQIAPVESVRAVLPLLTGAAEARFEIVPGGHLGLLTGRTARDALWASLDEWLDEWSA